MNTGAASFTFSSSEPGSTFECRLDTGEFSPCTSPAAFTLADGPHTLQVRAIDVVGNIDDTPASRTWTVDTVAPDTTIESGPGATDASPDAAFTFSSNEGGSSFACRLDDAAFTACASPASYSGLPEGAHTFEVQATDPAGNVDGTPASQTWTIAAQP